MRDVINASMYYLQSGGQWSMLPRDFPPPSLTTKHCEFLLQTVETWKALHDGLYCQMRVLEGKPSYTIIDSQSAKTGPDARETVGFDAGKKVKGRKRHILVDTLGLILKCAVHGADIQDRDGAAHVFVELLTLTQQHGQEAVEMATRIHKGELALSHGTIELPYRTQRAIIALLHDLTGEAVTKEMNRPGFIGGRFV